MKNRGLSEDQVDEMTREAGIDKDDYVNYKKFLKVKEARYYQGCIYCVNSIIHVYLLSHCRSKTSDATKKETRATSSSSISENMLLPFGGNVSLDHLTLD